MTWFEGFEQRSFEVNGASINARISTIRPGDALRPALLLLHGFPQSHVMWHRVAKQLAKDYFLVMPDLRGYGESSKTPGLPDHSNYSKRNMAHDMALVMDALHVIIRTSTPVGTTMPRCTPSLLKLPSLLRPFNPPELTTPATPSAPCCTARWPSTSRRGLSWPAPDSSTAKATTTPRPPM